MKICENCGMEYGDNNPFCPFCDERYGVVILVDDVISADGLPPYKEEFPVIGETGVKQESFAANRDKIYKRNIRLAARENFLPKMKVRAVYKPVAPLAEIGGNGAISPYKPPNPIVEKFNSIRKKIKTIKLNKTGKAALCGLSVAAVFLLIIGVSWFETIDYQKKQEQAAYTEAAEEVFDTIEAGEKVSEYLSADIPEKITITGEDSLRLKLSYVKKSDTEGVYIYAFEFTNTTDEAIVYFCNKFIRADYTDRFVNLSVLYPNGKTCLVFWKNGVPGYVLYSGVDENGLATNVPPYVDPNDTVSGNVYIDFGDKD